MSLAKTLWSSAKSVGSALAASPGKAIGGAAVGGGVLGGIYGGFSDDTSVLGGALGGAAIGGGLMGAGIGGGKLWQKYGGSMARKPFKYVSSGRLSPLGPTRGGLPQIAPGSIKSVNPVNAGMGNACNSIPSTLSSSRIELPSGPDLKLGTPWQNPRAKLRSKMNQVYKNLDETDETARNYGINYGMRNLE